MTFHPLGSTFVRADVTRSIRTGPIVLLAVFVRFIHMCRIHKGPGRDRPTTTMAV